MDHELGILPTEVIFLRIARKACRTVTMLDSKSNLLAETFWQSCPANSTHSRCHCMALKCNLSVTPHVHMLKPRLFSVLQLDG